MRSAYWCSHILIGHSGIFLTQPTPPFPPLTQMSASSKNKSKNTANKQKQLLDHHGRDLTLTNLTFRARDHDPEQSASNPLTWLPVYDYKSRRSPQSTKAVKAAMAYFGGVITSKSNASPIVYDLDVMWDQGWRWTFYADENGKNQAHTWYPPLADVLTRGLSASIGSPEVLATLERLNNPVDRTT